MLTKTEYKTICNERCAVQVSCDECIFRTNCVRERLEEAFDVLDFLEAWNKAHKFALSKKG